jgi:predicted enzyme related to lactoylglutathione lyase
LKVPEAVVANPELNLLVLRSADIERAARFYEALGIQFTREKHGSGPEHFAGQAGSVLLEIYPQGDGESTSKTRIGFKVNSLAGLLTDLEQAGGTVIAAPQDTAWGRRAVMADPDGHRVELVETP